METTVALFGICAALLVGAMSPGPSFALVAHTAIALSRKDGLAAALGMGIGALIFGVFVLLGLHVVLAQVGWLYLALKMAGGVYLLYLALSLWRGATDPIVVRQAAAPLAPGLGRSFSLGLATQLSNPKTAVVYGGIFAALLPPEPPLWFSVLLLALIVLIEAGWYAIVALAFSAERPRTAYLRSKTWIDRIAGAVLGALGLRLILEMKRSA